MDGCTMHDSGTGWCGGCAPSYDTVYLWSASLRGSHRAERRMANSAGGLRRSMLLCAVVLLATVLVAFPCC